MGVNPYAFSKDANYYLKDNPETQVWELHRVRPSNLVE
jgi:hypothetical protein